MRSDINKRQQTLNQAENTHEQPPLNPALAALPLLNGATQAQTPSIMLNLSQNALASMPSSNGVLADNLDQVGFEQKPPATDSKIIRICAPKGLTNSPKEEQRKFIMLKPNNKRAGLTSSPGKDPLSLEDSEKQPAKEQQHSPNFLTKRPYENAFPLSDLTPVDLQAPETQPAKIEVTPSKKIVLNFSKMPVVVNRTDEREYSDDEEQPEEEDSEQIIYSNSYGESSEKEHSESGSVLNQYYQQQQEVESLEDLVPEKVVANVTVDKDSSLIKLHQEAYKRQKLTERAIPVQSSNDQIIARRLLAEKSFELQSLTAQELLRKELIRQAVGEASNFNTGLQYRRLEQEKQTSLFKLRQTDREKLSHNFSCNFLHSQYNPGQNFINTLNNIKTTSQAASIAPLQWSQSPTTGQSQAAPFSYQTKAPMTTTRLNSGRSMVRPTHHYAGGMKRPQEQDLKERQNQETQNFFINQMRGGPTQTKDSAIYKGDDGKSATKEGFQPPNSNYYQRYDSQYTTPMHSDPNYQGGPSQSPMALMLDLQAGDFQCITCRRGPPHTKKYAKNQCQTCYKKEKRNLKTTIGGFPQTMNSNGAYWQPLSQHSVPQLHHRQQYGGMLPSQSLNDSDGVVQHMPPPYNFTGQAAVTTAETQYNSNGHQHQQAGGYQNQNQIKLQSLSTGKIFPRKELATRDGEQLYGCAIYPNPQIK